MSDRVENARNRLSKGELDAIEDVLHHELLKALQTAARNINLIIREDVNSILPGVLIPTALKFLCHVQGQFLSEHLEPDIMAESFMVCVNANTQHISSGLMDGLTMGIGHASPADRKERLRALSKLAPPEVAKLIKEFCE